MSPLPGSVAVVRGMAVSSAVDDTVHVGQKGPKELHYAGQVVQFAHVGQQGLLGEDVGLCVFLCSELDFLNDLLLCRGS